MRRPLSVPKLEHSRFFPAKGSSQRHHDHQAWRSRHRSQCCASILFRMISDWAKRKGIPSKVLDETEVEEAGTKTATIQFFRREQPTANVGRKKPAFHLPRTQLAVRKPQFAHTSFASVPLTDNSRKWTTASKYNIKPPQTENLKS